MTLLDSNTSIVVFRNAAVRRGGNLIWSNGTFSIPTGTISAIVGSNGAGKTTLLNVELGLLPLTQGEVTVLGKPAGVMNHSIGYVPQDYASDIDSNITAEQSVELGLYGSRFGWHRRTKKDKDKIHWALLHAGIADKAKYRLSEMSGGMRQRVAIAQALVAEPALLLLDEPMANLDIAGQRDLADTLSLINSELHVTIQIVAHDINVLLPILDGAIYLLDRHPHYSALSDVMDNDLLTHLYGTDVEVISTPQGEMFIRPDPVVRHHAPASHFYVPSSQQDPEYVMTSARKNNNE